MQPIYSRYAAYIQPICSAAPSHYNQYHRLYPRPEPLVLDIVSQYRALSLSVCLSVSVSLSVFDFSSSHLYRHTNLHMRSFYISLHAGLALCLSLSLSLSLPSSSTHPQDVSSNLAMKQPHSICSSDGISPWHYQQLCYQQSLFIGFGRGRGTIKPASLLFPMMRLQKVMMMKVSPQ